MPFRDLDVEIEGYLMEIKNLREKNSVLNRRAQAAESRAGLNLDKARALLLREAMDRQHGEPLSRIHATFAMEEMKTLLAEVRDTLDQHYVDITDFGGPNVAMKLVQKIDAMIGGRDEPVPS